MSINWVNILENNSITASENPEKITELYFSTPQTVFLKIPWSGSWENQRRILLGTAPQSTHTHWKSSQEWAISIFWSSSVKVVVVVEAIVARSVEKALRQVSLELPSSWNLNYLTMKHPEKLSWAHQDYFREILQEEQMASQVRVQSAWLENRRELREKYLNVIKKLRKGDWNLQVAYI